MEDACLLRKRLVARDEGLLPSASTGAGISFNEWTNWFLENRSQPPFRKEKTHQQNFGALKFVEPRFGKHRFSDIMPEDIEAYLMSRLNTRKSGAEGRRPQTTARPLPRRHAEDRAHNQRSPKHSAHS